MEKAESYNLSLEGLIFEHGCQTAFVSSMLKPFAPKKIISSGQQFSQVMKVKHREVLKASCLVCVVSFLFYIKMLSRGYLKRSGGCLYWSSRQSISSICSEEQESSARSKVHNSSNVSCIQCNTKCLRHQKHLSLRLQGRWTSLQLYL